jgi:putative endopeptidase
MRSFSIPLALVTMGLACGPQPLPPIAEAPEPVVATQTLAEVGLDAAAMDRSVDPCRDFYQFACGGWVKTTEIPADQPRWMRSFNVILDRNLDDLRAVLEESAEAPTSPAEKKVGDYYAACMDEAAIENAGLTALAPLRRAIHAVAAPADATPPPKAAPKKDATKKSDPKDAEPAADAWSAAGRPSAPAGDLEALLAMLHRHEIWAFFDVDSSQDYKDATRMIAVLDQNGLGLPDRDDYARDDEKTQELRAFYVDHVARMLALAGHGEEEARRGAEAVMRIETAIAAISKTRVERRDPDGMYNKIDRSGLRALAGPFDWDRYLTALGAGMDGVEDVNVTSKPYFERVGALAKELPKPDLAFYLEWQLLHHLASSLPKRFDDEAFSLERKITGQKEQKPRWKRCVTAADAQLGELLAQPYVKKRFGPESKRAVQEMVGAISAAFRDRVGQLSWMDAPTKARALEKLGTLAYLIGYPDKWKSYDFPVTREGFVDNVLAANAHERARELEKIGKPVDRGEWFMTPPTVNAYYSALRNQMVFPAGILQPPFFNPEASVAVNMGGMGMVVGHELTHGFDDKGSKFDSAGNLKSWWSPTIRDEFDARTKCVEKQYGAYEVLPGVRLDGKLTLGENIADIGGVRLAFDGYRRLRESANDRIVAEGFDEDQQFFLSVAQVWCSKYTDELKRTRAQTDPHSQPDWRVNGSLQNTPAFAEAFECAPGTPMNPAQKCEVW